MEESMKGSSLLSPFLQKQAVVGCAREQRGLSHILCTIRTEKINFLTDKLKFTDEEQKVFLL